MPTAAHRLARARALESMVRDIARAEILPRYLKSARNRKADGSLFTEADMASQQRFSEALPAFLPGAVLGEEMTAAEQGRCGTKAHAACGASTRSTAPPTSPTASPVRGVDRLPDRTRAGDRRGLQPDHRRILLRRPRRRRLPQRRPSCRCGRAPPSLRDAVAGVDFKRISHHLGDELAVRPPYYSQRNFGSSALEWCFVAAGRLDVYLHGGQMLWDYAAGRLILAEAGGVAEALDGGVLMSGPAIKRGVIAAASPALFAEWSAWVKARS
jgi:fructose-1,6-bisphosphatase/inositol monophosphatase family enzyme